MFAMECDSRWHAVDTAAVRVRCDALVVRSMGLPHGTAIDLHTCDVTLRE